MIFGLLLFVKTDDHKAIVNWEGKGNKRNDASNNARLSIRNQREKQNAKNYHENNSNYTTNDVWHQERWFAFDCPDD
jgi:hypothetical protein